MKNYVLRRYLTICVSVCSLTFIAGMCDDKEPAPKPVARFTYVPSTNLIAPVTISFTNESKHATSYLWETSDGQTSTDENVRLTVRSGSTITMTLTATGEGGTDTYSRTLTVAEPTTPPSSTATAGFTYSPAQNLVAPAKVTFTNTSKNADSYRWDFGDGTTASDVNPVKEFTKSGTFSVKLTATGKTNSADYSANITVNAATPLASPTADFSYTPTTPTIEDNVFFTNKSANAGSYEWDFGDGNKSTETNPNRKFTKAGNYTVTLKAKGSDGKTADVTKTLVVTDNLATVSFFTKTDFGFGKINLYEGTQPGLGYGTISTLYTNGITCGASNNTVKIAPRTLNWVGEAENGIKWAGTVQLEAGKCYAIELTRTNIINGIVTFWTKSDLKVGKISVAVNGVAQGDITHYHSSGVTCGQGDVNAKVNVGTYKFKAVAADGTIWEDSVTFDRGVCKTQELTKSSTPTTPSGSNCDWNKYTNDASLGIETKWGSCGADGLSVRITNKTTITLQIFLAIEGKDGKWGTSAGSAKPGATFSDWSCSNTGKYKVWAISNEEFNKNNCPYPKP